MFIDNKFFKYSIGIILITLIIFMLGQIKFFLAPFLELISVFFMPFLLSIFLYYMLRPIVNFIKRFKVNHTLSILITFLIVLSLFSLFITYSGNIVIKQFSQLINNLPQIAQYAKESATNLINNNKFGVNLFGNIQAQITQYLQNILPFITNGVANTLGIITNAASIILIVPFILFYILHDDKLFFSKLLAKIPAKFKDEFVNIVKEADKTLSTYIIGQALIALILGFMMYIGYLIIGLDYAFLLALFVVITAFIPLFGTIIGVVPAFLVALTINPFTGLKVVILTIIVQQIEGNFISPGLVGKRLSIHPLTIILIFLGATSIWGFIGMLIAIPFYAVLKIILKSSFKIYQMTLDKDNSDNLI